jgi:hypothetical protein
MPSTPRFELFAEPQLDRFAFLGRHLPKARLPLSLHITPRPIINMDSHNAEKLIERALALEIEYTGTIKERPNLDERVGIWEAVLNISRDPNSDAGEDPNYPWRL